MMKRLRLFNAIGEAVIPLLGLLFFEWGLYFILLFYFIDLIASEVFLYFKVNKVIKFQRINFPFSTRYGRLILNNVLALLIILISHIAVYFIVSGIDFKDQFVEFLMYEEVGFPFPQGYILLPLVIFGNWQQYKMQFVKTGLFKVTSWKDLILSRRKALFIAIAGGILAIGIANIVPLPEFIYVLAIIAAKFYIDMKIQ